MGLCGEKRVVMDATEQYRNECEARLLLTWPLEKRRAYLMAAPVQGRVEKLKAEILRQWKLTHA